MAGGGGALLCAVMEQGHWKNLEALAFDPATLLDTCMISSGSLLVRLIDLVLVLFFLLRAIYQPQR